MLIMYHVSIFLISLINSSLTIEFCCKTFLMLILEQAFALSVKTLKYRTSLNIIWITWKNWRAALIIRYTVVILFELHSCKKIFIKKRHIGFILKNSFTIFNSQWSIYIYFNHVKSQKLSSKVISLWSVIIWFPELHPFYPWVELITVGLWICSFI